MTKLLSFRRPLSHARVWRLTSYFISLHLSLRQKKSSFVIVYCLIVVFEKEHLDRLKVNRLIPKPIEDQLKPKAKFRLGTGYPSRSDKSGVDIFGVSPKLRSH